MTCDWISVNEKMPECGLGWPSKIVIILTDKGWSTARRELVESYPERYKAIWVQDGVANAWDQDISKKIVEKNVTHWLELPPFPTKSQQLIKPE